MLLIINGPFLNWKHEERRLQNLSFEELSCGGTNPGVLSLVPDQSDAKIIFDGFPQPLSFIE